MGSCSSPIVKQDPDHVPEDDKRLDKLQKIMQDTRRPCIADRVTTVSIGERHFQLISEALCALQNIQIRCETFARFPRGIYDPIYRMEERIVGMSTADLHKKLRDGSLDATYRDKIKGELAVRKITAGKGKETVISGYDPGESSKSPSTLNQSTAGAGWHGSRPDHIAIEVAPPPEMTTVAIGRQCSGSAGGLRTTCLEDRTQGKMIVRGNCPLGSACQQVSDARHEDNSITRQASIVTPPSETGAYAHAGADIEAGGCTTYCGPPPEPIAMLGEPPAVILVAGAFNLLSGNRDTLQGPLGRVLLCFMTMGFLSSFAWLLMGRLMTRRSRASFFLQWTAVWSVFVAFFLVMISLIIH